MNYIIYTNLWIAIGAALISAQTQWTILGRTEPTLIAFVFFSTLATYNFHRLVRFNKWVLRVQSERLNFLVKWRKILTIITAISVCVAVILGFLTFNREQWIVMVLMAAIAAFYALPLQLNAIRLAPLREWPGFKVFLIGFSWAVVTAVLPLMSESNLAWSTYSYVAAERFFFILALTIPFDVRDLVYDLPGQKTIPQMLGERGAGAASIGCAILFLTIAVLNPSYHNSTIVALVVSGVSIMVALSFSFRKRSDSYYELLLDGMIILQPMLVLIFSFL